MKFILLHVPQMPGDKEKLAPIGRNVAQFQLLLDELRTLVSRADQLGFYGYGMAEHHFHTEGYEVNSQPMILYTWLASMTEQLKFIPLSLVPVSTNPLLIAEQVAMFDQIYPGRIEVALARGYQARWMQTLAQQENVASGLPGTESDTRNREIYKEYVEVIKLAWTEDAFEYKGKHIEVPYPHAGIENYPGAEVTRRFGSPEEIEGEDTIARIGVVPAPYTKPHPRLWVPFSLNPQTVTEAAVNGYVMLVSNSDPTKFQKFVRQYHDEAQNAGRDVKLGENLCAVREIVIGDSFDEAFDIACRGAGKNFFDYFQHFGFMENWRLPSDDPDNFPLTFDSVEELTQRWVDLDFCLCGTADQLCEKIAEIRTGYGIGAEIEGIAYQQSAQGAVDLDVALKQVERIGTEVLPRFQ